MTILEKIKERVKNSCTEKRAALLEPILLNLDRHKSCPASTSHQKHGAFSGGLLAHVDVIIDLAIGHASVVAAKMADAMVVNGIAPSGFDHISDSSIITCAILHDLNKVEDPAGNLHYVDNILMSGKQSDKKPWKISEVYKEPHLVLAERSGLESHWKVFLSNPAIQYPSGLISLMLAEKWSPGIVEDMTFAEKQAVVWHGSLYEHGNKESFLNNETLLQVIIHSADMVSAVSGI